MKLAIVGTRTPSISFKMFEHYMKVYAPSQIISGGAKGIDTYAADYAKAHDIPLLEILPDYAAYGKQATLRRNTQIVDAADKVIAFPGATSRGTYDTIKKAEKQGKMLEIINI